MTVAMLTFCCSLQRPHGRNAFAGSERAVLDQFRDAQRDLLIETMVAVQLLGSMSG